MTLPPILHASPETIARAAETLRTGGLVAFPTETVYGLGGDACDDRIAASIFEAKGRPSFNPLIVHVASLEGARDLVAMDSRAEDLARRYWPGAVTLVLPRAPRSKVSLLTCAGLDTIAIRIPDHPIALALLQAFGRPIAAPSANRSGEVSPTSAAHVAESFRGHDGVAMILDGGSCRIGLESTVIDLSSPHTALLRPGGIPREELEAVLGKMDYHGEVADAPKSPGQLLSHYAPHLPVRLEATEVQPGEVMIGFGASPGAMANLSPSGDLAEAAANLFAMLRAWDRADYKGIAVAPIPETGLGLAINDRLRRAAAPR